MHLRVFSDPRSAAAAVAQRIVECLRENPRLVLSLPTGRTPLQLYHELVARAARGGADFSQATTFNLDEFLGIRPDDPGSFRTYMERHLFSRIDLDRARLNFLDGSARDPDAECARYERAIDAAGGIDVQVLGIGLNGHIGFNEPGDALEARTHRVTLRPESRRANASLFDDEVARVPREALSMGMATILHARAIVLLATGRAKAACVRQAVEGPLTTHVPASFLQLHRDVTLMLDEAAASKLTAVGRRVIPGAGGS